MNVRISIYISVFLVCISGCGEEKPRHKTSAIEKDQAIVVLCDAASGTILQVDTFTAPELPETIIYTNGPSVRWVCLGELVNPDIVHMQISGEAVQLNCPDGRLEGMSGSTLIFESAWSDEFLREVEQYLASMSTATTPATPELDGQEPGC